MSTMIVVKEKSRDTAYSKVVFATSNGLLFDLGLIVAQASQLAFKE